MTATYDNYEQSPDCQAESLQSASTRITQPHARLRRAVECFRREGLHGSLKRFKSFTIDPLARSLKSVTKTPGLSPDCEVLKLQQGELVEVKSLAEILATLDNNRRLRGLSFLTCMEPFCSKRFLVYKRVETLYQEETRQVRRIKNTVLLSNVQCDGLYMKCDRCCYLLWREAWLRRCASPPIQTSIIRDGQVEPDSPYSGSGASLPSAS